MTTLTALKKSSRVSWRLLASALLATVFATGCGGGGGDDSTALDGAETAAATATTGSAASTGRAKANAATWVYCTYQGGTCSFSGTRQIRYAASNGAAVVKTFTNSVQCTDAVFGDPAYGVAKACYYDSSSTTTSTTTTTTSTSTASTSGSYSKSTVFPMRESYAWGQQGQYANLNVRFYGVPMYTNAKLLVHLYDANGSLRASTGHHLRYINTTGWRGYVQYAHPAYISPYLAVGTYRVVIGLYGYLSPWSLLLGELQAGGGTYGLGAGFVAGNISIGAATQAAVADATSGPFLEVAPSGWY